MYDFNFGTKSDIEKDPEKFLLFVKRLLPRWVNGVPDSECLALFRILHGWKGDQAVFLETGAGASSIALVLHCALYGGTVYSWDTNGSKGAFLRSVISDAICRVLGVDIHQIWKFIAFNSTDSAVGIAVVEELHQKANVGFFDSWHTLDHLMNEVKAFEKVAADEFVIALDDAYYRKKYQNFSYINMIRNKLGLAPVEEPSDNVCRPFYVEVDEYLRGKYANVTKVEDTYKTSYKDDIFFAYYEGDRKFMGSLGMEEQERLDHRFDAWVVSNKIKM